MDSPFFHHVPFHHPSCTFSSSITSHLANTLVILTDRKLTLIRIATNSPTAPSRRRAPHFVCAVFPLFPAPAKGSPSQLLRRCAYAYVKHGFLEIKGDTSLP